jgi:hypothetical protein
VGAWFFVTIALLFISVNLFASSSIPLHDLLVGTGIIYFLWLVYVAYTLWFIVKPLIAKYLLYKAMEEDDEKKTD